MGRKAVFCLLYFLAVVFTGLLLAAAVLSWRASFDPAGALKSGSWIMDET